MIAIVCFRFRKPKTENPLFKNRLNQTGLESTGCRQSKVALKRACFVLKFVTN